MRTFRQLGAWVGARFGEDFRAAGSELVMRLRMFFLKTGVSAGMQPCFIIIGGHRCGSTSLYQYMVSSPQIVPAWNKELHFFDLHYQNGLTWYRAHFSLTRGGGNAITGEATPYYLSYPHAAPRIRDAFPDMKLIVILRNPVKRAYSHYNDNVIKGNESLETFEEAIDREPERLNGEYEKMVEDGSYLSTAYRRYSYLARGVYADQLQHWLTYFSRDRFLILSSEAFYANPQQICNHVMDFLGVSHFELTLKRKFNSRSYAPMSAATEKRLSDYFRPHNKRLYDLVGRDFGWES